MLWVADHVHDGDTGLVQGVDDWLRWDSNGTNEERSFLLDNDVDELIELALGVVILGKGIQNLDGRILHEAYVGLPCVSTDLRDQKIDAERCVLILKTSFNSLNLHRIP